MLRPEPDRIEPRLPSMAACLGEAVAADAALVAHLLTPSAWRNLNRPVARVLVVLGMVPLLLGWQAFHWVCLLLDELFFRGYRQVTVKEPLFVLGPPRTGTTQIHHTLAEDPSFTTCRTWELILAPAIVQKKALRAIARLYRAVGNPGISWLKTAERRLFGRAQAVHRSGLNAPEEDYTFLLLTLSCPGLILAFPSCQRFWDLARFDEKLPERTRLRAVTFYRRCLQKHLYVFGENKRMLSKNAGFTTWVEALNQAFPDAAFVCCHRKPDEAVSSMLGCATASLRLVAADPAAGKGDFRERMVDSMEQHFRRLAEATAPLPADRVFAITLPEARAALDEVIEALYQHFGIPLTPSFRALLQTRSRASSRYSSGHRHDLTDFGLDPAELRDRFSKTHPQSPAEWHANQPTSLAPPAAP